MSDLKKNYELAFHINPNLAESRITEIKSELEKELVSSGAVISYIKEPERTRLSYPIKKNGNSYFGFIHFSTQPNDSSDNDTGRQGSLLAVEEYIKLNPDILRSLILCLPSDAQKNQAIMRQAKARERMEKKAKIAPKVPVVPNEKLDKELEDIIEKL